MADLGGWSSTAVSASGSDWLKQIWPNYITLRCSDSHLCFLGSFTMLEQTTGGRPVNMSVKVQSANQRRVSLIMDEFEEKAEEGK